jgi:hypothetical protein
MRLVQILTCVGVFAASTPALAADYSRPRHVEFNPPVVFVGIPAPKPIFLVASPPQYVMDLRTGRPGYWIIQQPSFFDRLFGERNGY